MAVTSSGTATVTLPTDEQILTQHSSKEIRDAHLEWMGDGMQDALDILERIAVSLR